VATNGKGRDCCEMTAVMMVMMALMMMVIVMVTLVMMAWGYLAVQWVQGGQMGAMCTQWVILLWKWWLTQRVPCTRRQSAASID